MRDVFYVFFRHSRPAALAFFAVLVTVSVYVASKPQSYRSEARLMVRLGRESVSLDPTAATGKTVSVSKSHQNEINSELEIIQSRDLLASVAAKTLVGNLDGGTELLEAARNEAAADLAERLRVEALEDTNIIRIAYDDPDRSRAQTVLTELIERYLERHIEVYRTPGAYEFFSEQVAERARKINELEIRTRDLKNESGIASIEDEREGLLERVHRRMLEIEDQRAELAAIDAERESADLAMPQVSDLRAELASIEAEKASVTDALFADDREASTAAGEPQRSTESLREELNTLRIQEEDLSARFTDAYPPLRSVRTRIAEAKRLLDSAKVSRQVELSAQIESQVGTQRSSFLARLDSRRAALQARIDSHLAGFSAQLDLRRSAVLARIRVLEGQVRIARERLEELNGQEILLARLNHELEEQRANYSRYAESLEQARIDQALENEQISNISLVQPATFPVAAQGPSRAFLVALGLILAAMAGTGVAFCLEFLDDSIHSPSVAEDRLQLPVLAALPKSVPDSTSGELFLRNGVGVVGGVTAELSALRDQLRSWRSDRSRAFPSSSPEEVASISKGVLRVRPGHGPSSPALLAITSCEIGSGVSTIASSVAAALARDGVKVLLVRTSGGLNGALADKAHSNGHRARGERGIEAGAKVTAEGVGLHTLDVSSLEHGSLSSVDELLWQLRSGAQDFEFVILDLPEISGMDSTTRLAALSDGVLLVVQADNTRWQAVDRAKQILVKAQANVLGTVINRRQFPIPEWLYARL